MNIIFTIGLDSTRLKDVISEYIIIILMNNIIFSYFSKKCLKITKG